MIVRYFSATLYRVLVFRNRKSPLLPMAKRIPPRKKLKKSPRKPRKKANPRKPRVKANQKR